MQRLMVVNATRDRHQGQPLLPACRPHTAGALGSTTALSSTTQALPSGELVGYQTSYGRMTAAQRGAAPDTLLQHLSRSRQRQGSQEPHQARHKVGAA
jgi:hypothetical protein